MDKEECDALAGHYLGKYGLSNRYTFDSEMQKVFFDYGPYGGIKVENLNDLSMSILTLTTRNEYYLGHHFWNAYKILVALDPEAVNTPPPNRLIGLLVDWATKFEEAPFLIEKLDKVSKIQVPKMYEGGQRSTKGYRYMPNNFTEVDLLGVLCASGDIPKTRVAAVKLYEEKKRSKNSKESKGLERE